METKPILTKDEETAVWNAAKIRLVCTTTQNEIDAEKSVERAIKLAAQAGYDKGKVMGRIPTIDELTKLQKELEAARKESDNKGFERGKEEGMRIWKKTIELMEKKILEAEQRGAKNVLLNGVVAGKLCTCSKFQISLNKHKEGCEYVLFCRKNGVE